MLNRVTTLTRMISLVVRLGLFGIAFTAPRATRSSTWAAVNPDLLELSRRSVAAIAQRTAASGEGSGMMPWLFRRKHVGTRAIYGLN